MLEVKEYQFKDIMLGFYDGPHATPPPSDEGPMFLGIKNIKKDGGIDFSNIRHIAKKDFAKWTKRVVPSKNDIVFSYEATLHRYALIPEGFNGCLGRRMALIRVNLELVNPRYLFLYFNSPYWKAFIETIKISGATVDRISIIDFPNYKIELPDLKTQNKLVEILSTYDDLIENNNQRIQLLEEMASEIYKEWFVRLRFPGYENAVFKDKDGKVVDRESDGALPDGWTNGVIGDFVEFKKGKNITKNTVKEGNVPVVAGGLTPAYFHNKANTKSPTMTISASGANAGYVNLYYENIWASDCSYLDSTMSELFYYFYLTLKTRQKEVFYLQRGAAQPHVYPNDIMGLDLVFPDKNTVYDFEELIQPFMDEIGILQSKNQVLQETRDLLLPRLISGKLSVEHLLDETYEPKEAIRTAAEPTAVYETKSIK